MSNLKSASLMMAVQSFKVRSLAPNKVSITRSIDLDVLSVRAPARVHC